MDDIKHSSGSGPKGRLGWALLLLFCLPFAGFGVMAMYGATKADTPQESLGLVAFGAVFIAIGLGIPIATWKIGKATAERQGAFPGQPWMWRDDWRSGRIGSASKAGAVVAWLMALAVLGVSGAMPWVIPEELAKGNQVAWLGLLFPIVGLGLLVWAGYVTARFRRFGACVFELRTLPGVVGGKLEGVIHVPSGLKPSDGCELRLLCINRYTTGTGRNRNTVEEVEWEATRTVAAGTFGYGPLGSEIPASFTIPYESRPSDPEKSDDCILWRLEARAEVPGIDFHAQFEVPVFRTEESSPTVVETQAPAPELAMAGTSDLGIEGSKVRIRPHGAGGKEFWFGPARHPMVAAGLTLVAMVVGAGGFGAAISGASISFQVALILVTLFMGGAALSLWLGTTRVRIDVTGVSIRRALLGIGRTRRIETDRITDFRVERGMNVGQTVYYDIHLLEKRDGRKPRACKAGSAIPDKRAAQGIAQAMKDALGR